MKIIAMIAVWASAGIFIYVYLVYPLLVQVASRLWSRPVKRSRDFQPAVTVLITAYNEEKNIVAKIDNVLELDYPPELLDVLVVSDASSDRTDEVVRSYGSPRVRLLRIEGRLGKTACQNLAVAQATRDIIAFTDATTRIRADALAAMVEDFADVEVGCVAGLLIYEGKGANLTAAGGVSYWNYEIALRSAESSLGTLIGVSGCFYAVRRSAYRPIEPGLISDFVIAMRVREQGLRAVLERRALCFEETLDRSGQELAMRVRVALRTVNALVVERRFLNPFADTLFAWQLWSHKVLRYATPYLLLMMLAGCAALARHPLYRLTLFVELAVIGAGIAGFLLQLNARRMGILSKPYYFLLTNLAAIIATLRYVKGERIVIWKPIR